MESGERVILVSGDGRKWFEQAIFIVRKGCLKSEMPRDLISEAERIVNGYLSSLGGNREGGGPEYRAGSVTAYRRNPDSTVTSFKMPEIRPKKRRRSGADLAVNLVVLACCAVLAAVLIRSKFML